MFAIQNQFKKASITTVEKGLHPKTMVLEKPLLKNKKKEKKRSGLILPKHIGRVFFVHNGKTFSSIHVYKKMLGHKFGEFVSTRKKPPHKKKK